MHKNKKTKKSGAFWRLVSMSENNVKQILDLSGFNHGEAVMAVKMWRYRV